MDKNEKKRVIIMVVVLIVIATVFFFDQGGFNLFLADVSDAITKPKQEIKESLISKNNLDQYVNQKAEPFIWVGNWSKDPFFYLNSDTIKSSGLGSLFGDKIPGTNETSLVLNGISVSGDSKIVLINGNILKLGGQVNGYSIAHISETYVDLKKGVKVVRLTLEE